MEDRELECLLACRRVLDAVRAESSPAARVVVSPAALGRPPRSLAVLPGAFDPPTLAHVALADAAHGLSFPAALFAVGCVTLDKERSGALLLEDRIALLSELAAGSPHLGVVVHNRGLYAGIAEALRRAFPTLRDLALVVGMDKVPQIFDPRYYEDLPAQLEALFSRARILVAPRGGSGREELEEILATPPARNFADRFEWLPLPAEWGRISATTVREAWAREPHVERIVPEAVAGFLRRTGALHEGPRYRRRRTALDAAARVRRPDPAPKRAPGATGSRRGRRRRRP